MLKKHNIINSHVVQTEIITMNFYNVLCANQENYINFPVIGDIYKLGKKNIVLDNYLGSKP